MSLLINTKVLIICQHIFDKDTVARSWVVHKDMGV